MPVLLFLAVIVAQAQTQTPPRDASAPARSSPAATLSGRITEQGSGQPITRAIVMLAKPGSPTGFETVADADGRYAFPDVEPGEYVVQAGPPELRATHLRQIFGHSEPGGMHTATQRVSTLRVKAGERRSAVDIALVRALAIEGRVVDPWDEPMAGVQIEIVRMDGTTLSQAQSDDRGLFRAFRLAPGRYRVCADVGDAYVDAADASRLVRTCHPGSVTEVGASDVVVTTADALGIDIRMQRTGAYSVSGSVVDATGAPVEAAFVKAYSLEDPQVSSNDSSRNGQFTLKGVTPGRHVVVASIGCPPDQRCATERPLEMGYAWVDVTGDLSGVAVSLARATTVKGRVVFEGSPAPAPNRLTMVVQTRPPADVDRAVPSQPPFSAVDDNLEFTLTGLYRLPLIVGIRGLPDGWAVQSVRVDRRDVTDIPVDLGDAEAPRHLEIVLTNRVANASVRVTDEQGQADTSYRLVILPADPVRWNGGTWLMETTPSPDGVVKLGPRAPGEYLIAALKHADALTFFSEHRRRLDDVAAIATRVRLIEGDTRTFDLPLKSLPPAVR
ncbi:MAG TPA: carboxypeptidase-like regulatory domain-containing protein [Vicinamibacterales bacterium]|nr:carboxypeptidase-like regulatory domain-containing protein [Vicinamibacterales bacterium]